MIRVLLMSPLAGRDPLSGDTSYTESLLHQPPQGVQYTTYEEALRDGTLLIRGRRRRHGPQTIEDLIILAARSVEYGLRRSQLMFREQYGYCTIKPGVFDLVHAHLFSVRQIGSNLPVVSSAGYPLSVLYKNREHWTPMHVALALKSEHLAARLCKVDVPWLGTHTPGVMTVYTDHFRNWLIARGIPAERILLAGTALPDLSLLEKRSDGRTLGFIGRDFNRKGGPIALAALRLLRKVDPTWHMLVATSDRDAVPAGEPGVEMMYDVPRHDILSEVLPRLDILLLPTKSDCGAPYSLLEALQSGVHAVISDLPWLDSRLRPPAVSRMSADPAKIANYVGHLSNLDLLQSQSAARELWQEHFTMNSLHTDLLRAYELALSQTRLTQ